MGFSPCTNQRLADAGRPYFAESSNLGESVAPLGSSVYVASVTDMKHSDHLLLVINLVNYPVVPYSNVPPFATSQFDAPDWSGIVGKSTNSVEWVIGLVPSEHGAEC